MSADWVLRHGIILFVEHYDAAVHFYRHILELPLLKDQGDLVILGFGDGYLMVEREGVAAEMKSRAQNPMVLRFNVADVEASAAMLRDRGVAVSVEAFPWGTVGKFRDPDGNPCELRNHYDGFFAPEQ